MNKLKSTREIKGYTQAQVAQKAQIPIRTYQNYESGERVPKVDTAKLIAKALGTTVEKLF